jgi:hypothetical protein
MIRRLLRFFDEAHEQAGWLVIVCSLGLLSALVVALLYGQPVPWQALAVPAALVAVGLLTLLGVQYYRGLHLGRFSISGDAQEDEHEPRRDQ